MPGCPHSPTNAPFSFIFFVALLTPCKNQYLYGAFSSRCTTYFTITHTMAPRHAKTTTSQNPPTAPNPSLSNDKSTPAQSVIHHNSKDRRTSSSQLPFGSSSNRYRTSLRPLEYIAEGSPTVEGGFSFSRVCPLRT